MSENTTSVIEEAVPSPTPPVAPVPPVDGVKALLSHIEATYALLQEGSFQGAASRRLIQVMAWLENYHKAVLVELMRSQPVPQPIEAVIVPEVIPS